MLTVLTVEEAQQSVIQSLGDRPGKTEKVLSAEAVGRVTAEEVLAPDMLPSFTRSTMDGYAVRSSDTFGATESLPALLKIKGEVLMGKEPPGKLEDGECMAISTGGMLPEGSDSVVMVEHCDVMGDQLAIFHPTAPFENTLQIGDDFRRGEVVFSGNHLIRPQDVGVLSAFGILQVNVYRPVKVIIFSTGDEIVPPDREEVGPGQIRDVNGYLLMGQVRECGALAEYRGIIADESEELEKALLASLEDSDMVLISGGSSVGKRDVAVNVMDNLPEGGVLFHGVSMRPGKPLIYGTSMGKPVFGLSGNPVSAMFSNILFVKPAIRYLQGLSPFPAFTPYVGAYLDTNYSSPGGREDYVRVSLYKQNNTAQEEEIWATPVFGGPGLLNTVIKGEGYFVIPRDVEGLSRGSKVAVHLF